MTNAALLTKQWELKPPEYDWSRLRSAKNCFSTKARGVAARNCSVSSLTCTKTKNMLNLKYDLKFYTEKKTLERLIGKMCPKLRQKTQKGKDHQDCGGILI